MIRYSIYIFCIFILCTLPVQATLRITEIFVDGSDEWIEVYNDSSQARQGTFTLSGVRSSGILEHTSQIDPYDTIVIADDSTDMQQVPGTVEQGDYKLSFSDTQAINIQLMIHTGVQDTVSIPASIVGSVNNSPVSLEYYQGIRQATSSHRSSGVLSGYIAHPGEYPVSSGGTQTQTGNQQTGNTSSATTGSSVSGSGTHAGGFTGGLVGSHTGAASTQSGSQAASYTGSFVGSGSTMSGSTVGSGSMGGSGTGLQTGLTPSACHSSLPRPLSIQEIHVGMGQHPSYIELYVHAQRSGTIVIDGSGIQGNIHVHIPQVFPGEHLLITPSMQGFHHTQHVYLDPNLSIMLTGSLHLSSNNIGSSWSQRVDWGHHTSTSLSSFSLYVDSLSTLSTSMGSNYSSWFQPVSSCYNEANDVDKPSPGFHRQWLSYIPVQHQTQVQYITPNCPTTHAPGSGSSSGSSSSSSGGSSSSPGSSSGHVNTTGNQTTGSVYTQHSSGATVSGTGMTTGQALSATGWQISLIDYNPDGSDTNRERVGIRYTSGQTSVMVHSDRRLEYDGKTHVFSSGSLVLGEEYIRTDNFRLVNSREVCVDLWYKQDMLTQSCYDPAIHDSPYRPYDASVQASSSSSPTTSTDTATHTQAQSNTTSPGSSAQSLPQPGQILMQDIVYNPPGSDTDNESITFVSSRESVLDMTDWRVRVNGRNKRIDTTLAPGQSVSVQKTRGMSNSKSTCLELVYEDTVYDTYCYDPDDVSTQEQQTLQAQEVKQDTDGLWTGSLDLVGLVYDPPGADTDKEELYLVYSGASHAPDFSQGRYLMVNDKRVSLVSYLRTGYNQSTTLYGSFGLYNSRPTCVQVWQDASSRFLSDQQDYLHDEYCYNPESDMLDQSEQEASRNSYPVGSSPMSSVPSSPSSSATGTVSSITHPSLHSLLPNPHGSDKDKEYIRLLWNGKQTLDLKSYSISINGRMTRWSEAYMLDSPGRHTVQVRASLPNSTSCIGLWFEKETLIDSICYTQTQDDVWVSRSLEDMEELSVEELRILRSIRQRNRGEYVCQEREGYRLGCRKRVIRTLPLQELRIKSAYIRQLESFLKDNRYTLWKRSELSYYSEIYRWAMEYERQDRESIQFGPIAVPTHQLDLRGVLAYTQTHTQVREWYHSFQMFLTRWVEDTLDLLVFDPSTRVY